MGTKHLAAVRLLAMKPCPAPGCTGLVDHGTVLCDGCELMLPLDAELLALEAQIHLKENAR
jgi:hypothetical protein